MLVVAARIRYPDDDWVYVPLSPSPLFPGQRVGAWQARAEGVVEFMRTGHHWMHGGIPVFTLDGSQSITFEAIRTSEPCQPNTPAVRLDSSGSGDGGKCGDPEEHDPELVLTCNGNSDSGGRVSIDRGYVLTCTASAKPTGRLTNFQWTFTSAEFGGITEPAPSAQWAGEMVTSGSITLSAELNGSPASESKHVTVEAREWIDEAPPIEEEYVACTTVSVRCLLKYPPEEVRDLAQTAFHDKLYLTERAKEILNGPNRGLVYIVGEEPAVHFGMRVLFLNELLRNPNDPFFKARPDCMPDALLASVRRHEQKHEELFREEIAQGFSRTWAEWLVMRGPLGQALPEIARRQQEIEKHILTEMGGANHRPTSLWKNYNPSCDVRLAGNGATRPR